MTNANRITVSDGMVTDRRETGHAFEMQVRLDGFSNRIRVDDYRGSVEGIADRLEELVRQHSSTKTIVRVRPEHVNRFLSLGYEIEGIYRGFYNGSDAYAMTKYYSVDRRNSDFWLQEDQILMQVRQLPRLTEKSEVDPDYLLRKAGAEDAEQLAQLYASAFPVYPTPVNQPDYVAKTMEEGTMYHVIEKEGQIVSAAAAHVNNSLHHAEIADCATHLAHQKKGFMKQLVQSLELELHQRRIYCVFSHARSLSIGMNAVFHQLGYTYAGRLTKNCIIYDAYEDMSLWMKDLATEKQE
jgi:putative beta-lysine N-acetyltransferase